ncbi:MAG: hypothetical protein WAW59_01810 [Patescibacteria group bacterium]
MDVFSGSLFSLLGRVGTLESSVPTESVTESSDDTGILSAFIRTLEKLFVQMETVFNEIVTFVKSVTFQSDVVFEERVVFEDADMAGTAVILAGANSVRIDFARPYATIPAITVSADAFVTYRVTDKGVTGFTIETQNNVSSDTRFDWIALMVTGSSVTSSTAASGELAPVESTIIESVSEVIAIVTEESPEESLPVGLVEEEIAEETTGSTLEETPEEEITTEVIPEEALPEDISIEVVSDTNPVESTAPEALIESIVTEVAPTEPTTEVTTEVVSEVSTVSGE